MISVPLYQLRILQEAKCLATEVYVVTKRFPPSEDRNLTSQLRRSCVSVVANISEGSGRKTKADFCNFISIARGSARETAALLALAEDLGFAKKEETAMIRRRYQGLDAAFHRIINEAERMPLRK